MVLGWMAINCARLVRTGQKPESIKRMCENYTYILRCADGTLYTGWTNNLEKRVKTHNQGKASKYTRTRLPAELVYYEVFETKQEAMSREWHIKRLSRQEKEKLIGNNC